MKLRLNLKTGSVSAVNRGEQESRRRAILLKAHALVKNAQDQARYLTVKNKALATKNKWTPERIEAEKQKLDLGVIRAKVKANSVFIKYGMAPAFEISATDLAAIPVKGPRAPAGNKVLRPYLQLFKIHGFSQSLLEIDPKAALAFKPSAIGKLADDISSHAHLFSGDLHKRVGVTPKNLPNFLSVVEDAGYPTAPFGFEKLDPKLKVAIGSIRHSSRSVVSPSYMFTRHRTSSDSLLVEFGTYLKKLSADTDSAASMIAAIPLLSGLPTAGDRAAWNSLAEAYLGYAFGDAALYKRGMSALMPKAIVSATKIRDLVLPRSLKVSAERQEASMAATFMLHRLLASLLFFSKKEKWSGEDKAFVDRMVNAYATMLVSASTVAQTKTLYPTISMLQVFYLQSKTADSILAADGIKSKLAVLMKPYVAIPSVRSLYSAAPAATSKTSKGSTLTPEKPLRLTAAKLVDLTPENLAWMLANDPVKLLKLYGDSPQFDLDFSAIRAREMVPVVKFLAASPEYALNVPTALHEILHTRWRVPAPTPSLFARAYSKKARIALEDIARIATFGSVSTRDLDSLVPKLTDEASQYLVLQLVAKSATATKGAFGKISEKHANLNQIDNVGSKVLASDLINDDVEKLRANFNDAQKTIDGMLLNAALGALDMTDVTNRVKEAYKEVTKLNGKLSVTKRAITDADIESIASYMTMGHRIVAFKVDNAFNVKSKAKPLATGEGRIVERVWHGTDPSAASCIALTGFKVTRQNIKAGRSMGSVVYVAPNADKSMQYLGNSFGRNSSGILFTGPAYVKGQPKIRIDGKQTSNYDWTKTARFSTEEIGLVNANVQFGIDAAYSVTACSGQQVRSTNSSITEIRRVAGTAIAQLLSKVKGREAQSKISAVRSVPAILAVLKSYKIHIVLIDPNKPTAKDRRVFHFVD